MFAGNQERATRRAYYLGGYSFESGSVCNLRSCSAIAIRRRGSCNAGSLGRGSRRTSDPHGHHPPAAQFAGNCVVELAKEAQLHRPGIRRLGFPTLRQGPFGRKGVFRRCRLCDDAADGSLPIGSDGLAPELPPHAVRWPDPRILCGRRLPEERSFLLAEAGSRRNRGMHRARKPRHHAPGNQCGSAFLARSGRRAHLAGFSGGFERALTAVLPGRLVGLV